MGQDKCSTHGCGSHGSSHHHGHGSGCGCQCNCGGCCCNKSHQCCSGEHDHCHFTDELTELADDAWMEVLYDKIKEQIITKHSDRLGELAQIVADSNSERWKHKLGLQKLNDDYKQKVAQFFSCKK